MHDLAASFSLRFSEASDFNELIQLLENRTVAGALYDQYSFASQQDKLDETIMIESLLPNEVEHGILLHSDDKQLRECLSFQVRNFRGMAFTELANSIEALSVCFFYRHFMVNGFHMPNDKRKQKFQKQ